MSFVKYSRLVFKSVMRTTVALAMAGALAALSGISQAATSPGWRITATMPDNSTLEEIAATGPGNAWTAGMACNDVNCMTRRLLVRHWNGKVWTSIAAPKSYQKISGSLLITSVAAAPGTNTWIMSADESAPATSVLHRTGKCWGAATTLPGVVLAAVAPAATDAWAFGMRLASSTPLGAAPYAAHFDGRKWSAVKVPVIAAFASATSARNIWVMGPSPTSTQSRLVIDVANFNGSTWRTIPLPSLGLKAGQKADEAGIAAIGVKNVWAGVMIVNASSGQLVRQLLLHWNGAKWTIIKSPYGGLMMTSIVQDGHGGVWTSAVPLSSALSRWHFEHYSNGAWTRTAVPARAESITSLTGLAWIPGTRSVWSTGEDIPTGTNPSSPAVILKYGA